MNREHNMKTVTVVIPSYNRAKILPKTIPTYLQPDVNELIIIDDCSSDNTEQVVKKLQKKYPIIKYFRNEVNSKQIVKMLVLKMQLVTTFILEMMIL